MLAIGTALRSATGQRLSRGHSFARPLTIASDTPQVPAQPMHLCLMVALAGPLNYLGRFGQAFQPFLRLPEHGMGFSLPRREPLAYARCSQPPAVHPAPA